MPFAPLEFQVYGYGIYHLLAKKKTQLKEMQQERAKIQNTKFQFDPNVRFGIKNSALSREIQEKKQREDFESHKAEMLRFLDPQIAQIENEITHLEAQLKAKQDQLPDARSEINEAIAAYRKKVHDLFAEYNSLHKTIKKNQPLFKDCGIALADYHSHFLKDLCNIPNPSISAFDTLELHNFSNYVQ